eukprot:COSAG01_NODE_4264_length_5198_cov_3.619337_2_plen_79_part_00
MTEIYLVLGNVCSCREILRRNGRGQDIAGTLQRGGQPAEEALRAVLEHTLEVLEAMSAATPRRRRKHVVSVLSSLRFA